MSTSLHPPGPWKTFAVYDDVEIRAEDGTLIAVVHGKPGGRKPSRAIAKVPELLEFVAHVEAMLTRQGWRPEGFDFEAELLRDARALLATITGIAP